MLTLIPALTKLAVQVLNGGTKFAHDQVGQGAISLLYVYDQPDHEIHLQWLPLLGADPKRSSQLCGYVKLSVEVNWGMKWGQS